MARAKQGELEGIRPKAIKAVEDAAEEWLDAKAELKAQGVTVKELEAVAIAAMKAAKITTYCAGGFILAIEDEEKLKGKRTRRGASKREDEDEVTV